MKAAVLSHPAFRSAADVLPLSGFSGAIVAIIDGQNPLQKRVRKAATSLDGSGRLQAQMCLQQQLHDRLDGLVGVPEILETGEAEGCFWYDMKAVAGIDAIEYLATGTREKVENLLRQLHMVLQSLAAISQDNAPKIDIGAAIGAKLDEIDLRTSGRYSCHIRALQSALETALGGAVFHLAPGFAHGDLTLENILVDGDGKIWLIDTIPSPFDHYWIDLAKLFQDLDGRWFLNRGRALSIGVTRTLSERLMRLALDLDPRYGAFHPVLLGLTFARILPYCKTKDDVGFVLRRIDDALASPTRTKEPTP